MMSWNLDIQDDGATAYSAQDTFNQLCRYIQKIPFFKRLLTASMNLPNGSSQNVMKYTIPHIFSKM
ncbi:hypothetical protein BDFB_010575, partial [Asbolus verrucosus]